MTLPDFSFETEASKKGYKIIAGLDEVGRGAFAGPVVAGCVVFDQNVELKLLASGVKINDSKKLSAKQREKADEWIRENCLAFGIGQTSVVNINRHGIKKATELAFRKSIKNCSAKIDYLLIDAFNIPRVNGLDSKHQNPIVKGDSRSISIAAASIVAKVYRDNLMTELSCGLYKKYNWHKNKGYGTLFHRKAIQTFGICKLHRKKFVETTLKKN